MSDRNDLKAYLDGELSPERTEEIRAALESDPELQREFRDLQLVSQMVSELSGNEEAIGLELTLTALRRKPVDRRIVWHRTGWVMGTVCAGLAGVVFYLLSSKKPMADSVAFSAAKADASSPIAQWSTNKSTAPSISPVSPISSPRQGTAGKNLPEKVPGSPKQNNEPVSGMRENRHERFVVRSGGVPFHFQKMKPHPKDGEMGPELVKVELAFHQQSQGVQQVLGELAKRTNLDDITPEATSTSPSPSPTSLASGMPTQTVITVSIPEDEVSATVSSLRQLESSDRINRPIAPSAISDSNQEIGLTPERSNAKANRKGTGVADSIKNTSVTGSTVAGGSPSGGFGGGSTAVVPQGHGVAGGGGSGGGFGGGFAGGSAGGGRFGAPEGAGIQRDKEQAKATEKAQESAKSIQVQSGIEASHSARSSAKRSLNDNRASGGKLTSDLPGSGRVHEKVTQPEKNANGVGLKAAPVPGIFRIAAKPNTTETFRKLTSKKLVRIQIIIRGGRG